jgi:hypothetical protein
MSAFGVNVAKRPDRKIQLAPSSQWLAQASASKDFLALIATTARDNIACCKSV